jgi:acetolactate synthase-1/2/3 large subunit
MVDQSTTKYKTVAETLAQTFYDHNVTHIYGVPGGGSSLPLIEAAAQLGIKFVLTRTECGAMIMASAAAELTGSIGVALTTKGPGVASAVNGAACALLDRAPVILVTDGFTEQQASFITHQFIDQKSLLAPVTKGHSRLEDNQVLGEINRLINLAMTAPCGPVHIELTGAIAKKELIEPQTQVIKQDYPLDIDNLESLINANQLITKSLKPVIVVGLEARSSENSEVIRQLIDRSGYPVLATYKAKGVISDYHPQYVGIFTGGTAESACVLQADLIILIGVDPVEFVLQKWRYQVPVIDISVVEYPIHYIKPDVGIYGSISINVGALLASISAKRPGWTLSGIEVLRQDMQHALQCQADQGIGPQDVVQVALESALATQTAQQQAQLPLIAVDAGAHMFSVMAFWPCHQPLDVLISNGLATMAYALPAAIAAAMNTSDRMVVAFTGDGGLLMCLGELSTAVEQGTHIIVIVFNDQSLSLIDIKQQASGFPSRGMRWQTPNFSQVMEGLGGRGYQVENLQQYRQALNEALKDGKPALIDVLVNPDGYAPQLKALRG